MANDPGSATPPEPPGPPQEEGPDEQAGEGFEPDMAVGERPRGPDRAGDGPSDSPARGA